MLAFTLYLHLISTDTFFFLRPWVKPFAILSPILNEHSRYHNLLFHASLSFNGSPSAEKYYLVQLKIHQNVGRITQRVFLHQRAGIPPSFLTVLRLCSSFQVSLAMSFTREVLSAVGSPEELHALNAIILVVSILSALGSAWMTLSFAVSD